MYQSAKLVIIAQVHSSSIFVSSKSRFKMVKTSGNRSDRKKSSRSIVRQLYYKPFIAIKLLSLDIKISIELFSSNKNIINVKYENTQKYENT